jgi:hypothetical protein
MAISTSLKRGSLDDAWDQARATSPVTALRVVLRSNETAARKVIAGGSLASTNMNGRSAAFSIYGPGQITPTEFCELWRALSDLFDSSNQFLSACALYGLDPDQTEDNGFPNPLPAQVQSPAAITDATIYAWMMAHLIAITEARSDYTRLRVATGLQYV